MNVTRFAAGYWYREVFKYRAYNPSRDTLIHITRVDITDDGFVAHRPLCGTAVNTKNKLFNGYNLRSRGIIVTCSKCHKKKDWAILFNTVRRIEDER